MNSWKKYLLILVSIALITGVVWKFDGMGLMGSFSRDARSGGLAQRNIDPKLLRNQDALTKYGLTLEEQANMLLPDGVQIYRLSSPSSSISRKKADEASKLQMQIVSEFAICRTGKNSTTISKMMIDFHGKGELYVSAHVDDEKMWDTDAGFYTAPNPTGFGKPGVFSYAMNKSILLDSPKCKKLRIYATSIGDQSEWILPLVKQVQADHPSYFVDGSGDSTKYTNVSNYKKQTTYGYGSVLFIGTDSGQNAPTSPGADAVKNIYQKIMTEKIVITRTSNPLIKISKKDIGAIGVNKPLVLSTFSICVQGDTPASISSLSLYMVANTSFTFSALLGAKPLWKDSLKDFEPLFETNSYMNKTFDFISDSPIPLAPGACLPITLFSQKVNPNVAMFIYPLIESINSNLQVEFHENYTDKTVVTVLGASNKPRGSGSMVLLHETNGPVFVRDLDTYVHNFTSPVYVGNNFFLHQSVGLPVHIKKANFVLQSNSNKPVDAELTFQKGTISYFDHLKTILIEQKTSKETFPANESVSVVIDMTLNPLEEINLGVSLTLPNVTATYILRLISLETDMGEIKLAPSNSIFHIPDDGKPFSGKNGSTLIVTLPGETQPGPVKAWGKNGSGGSVILPDSPPECPYEDKKKCCGENVSALDILLGKSKCKKPDGTPYTPDDLKKAVNSEDFSYAASILYALKINLSMWGSGTYTNQQAKDAIVKQGHLALGQIWITPFDKNSATTYTPKKINLTISSDNGAPQMTFLIGTGTSSKNYIVKSGVPFDIETQAFDQGGTFISIALKEYPTVKQNNFYIGIKLNSAQFVNSSDPAKVVPIVSNENVADGKFSILSMPTAIGTATFSAGGLFESKNFNIGPPFKQIVDMLTMTDKKELTMNSFCLMAKEKVTLKTFTFDHIVRDTSPFGSISLDTGMSTTGYLMKNGWSKHQAVFQFSSPITLEGGWETCFNLNVKGPVVEELESAYFDLIQLDAADASGAPISTYLKNGDVLSDENRIKGTQFDFL